jgi:hypothetical protein
MKKLLAFSSMLAFFVCGVGCDDKKGGSSGGGDAVDVVIKELGNAKVKAPAGSKAEDMMGDPAVKFPDGSMITFAKPSTIQEAELESAIKGTKELYDKASDFSQEKLENGWIYKFINDAPIGKMYMVEARLKVGDATWMCKGNANTPDQQNTAYNACKSLTK